MVKYGGTPCFEARFTAFKPEVESNGSWYTVDLELTFEPGTRLPGDLRDPSARVICAGDGTVIEYVVLEEGCDSEYQFTESEKAQISGYIRKLFAE
jgi:hypothetical protein